MAPRSIWTVLPKAAGRNELFGSLSGRIGAADYFRLTLAGPARLVIEANQLEADASLSLEDRTGGVVAAASLPGNDRVGMSVTLIEGTYLIRVQSDAPIANTYRLTYALYDPGAADVAAVRAGDDARLESSFARIESMLLPDLVREPPEDAGVVSEVITPEGEVLRALRFGGIRHQHRQRTARTCRQSAACRSRGSHKPRNLAIRPE